MDTATLKAIASQAQLTASLVSIYQIIAYSFISIRSVHFCNTSSSPVTVSLCFVPKGQTAGQNNAALWNFGIAANDFIEVCDQEFLPMGTNIYASASTAGVVNVFFSAIGL